MTEPNTRAITDLPQPTPPAAAKPAPPCGKSTPLALALSILALIIALAAGAGLYLAGKHQADRLQTANDQLNIQLHGLQTQLNSLTQQQQQTDTATQQHRQALADHLQQLEQQIAQISNADANHWRLAQAHFLVNMAGRKLWADQDSLTAQALLKSADLTLASLHDPGLIPVRRALAADIATLATLNQVDYDGIILQLNQLASQVDNLRLADSVSHTTPPDNAPLSASLRQWRQNLINSWHQFLDGFLTIRRRDTSEVPLLAPDQEIYLRENLRARLLIAAQAVPRHQQEIYQQSLEEVASWIRAYYNTDDAATKAFIATLEQLSAQPINMALPDALQSQSLLDKLIQTRIITPSTPPDSPAPEASAAPQPRPPAHPHQNPAPAHQNPAPTPEENAAPRPPAPQHQENATPQPPHPTQPHPLAPEENDAPRPHNLALRLQGDTE